MRAFDLPHPAHVGSDPFSFDELDAVVNFAGAGPLSADLADVAGDCEVVPSSFSSPVLDPPIWFRSLAKFSAPFESIVLKRPASASAPEPEPRRSGSFVLPAPSLANETA